VSCCYDKLVAEGVSSSGTQRKGNVSRWKPLPITILVTIDGFSVDDPNYLALCYRTWRSLLLRCPLVISIYIKM
jgi:hypothetical protein